MNLSPEQMTIAVTVYNRRQYVQHAIASALNQTRPVRVMVVEDCGPDPTLEAFVKAEFGSRIEYFRNPTRRGLFGNWNACLELCRTEWISILHDDDFLAPNYVEAMVKLAGLMPRRALYFGVTRAVGEDGALLSKQAPERISAPWEEKGLEDILFGPFWFPGHLFRVQTAIRVGKFRETSFFCGDWEMWARLMADGGGAQINEVVAFMREHGGPEKGTNKVIAAGRQYPLIYVQQKRILALLPEAERPKFDRSQFVKISPLPMRFLFRYADSLRPRLLNYHVRLFMMGRPHRLDYAIFQQLTRLGGVRLVKLLAMVWKQTQR
jgi:glycosyltransferase involved in cell wall biosynthesis